MKLRKHRRLYANAFGSLFHQGTVTEQFLATTLDSLFLMTLHHEKRLDTNLHTCFSVVSMKYFGTRLIEEVLDMCCKLPRRRLMVAH